MKAPKTSVYQSPDTQIQRRLTVWDAVVFLILFGIFISLSWGASQMAAPYSLGKPPEISLHPAYLPGYAINSVLRMLIALLASLIFTFTVAALAAKNKHAEKFILPMLDILESVPILGYLSISILAFIQLFPNSLLGPQLAAIFVIFTSQVWNMTLSLYQSLKTLPSDLKDTAAVFQLNAWQKFWRVEVPYAMPSLLWNTMISMSAGWFFVVASEAISVSNQEILLPGIGSYISLAIQEANLGAVYYAIGAMFLIILLYDQLLFRPLLAWMEHFKAERDENPPLHSWFYNWLVKPHFFKGKGIVQYSMSDAWLRLRGLKLRGFELKGLKLTGLKLTGLELRRFRSEKDPRKNSSTDQPNSRGKLSFFADFSCESSSSVSGILVFLWYVILWLSVVVASMLLFQFITETISSAEILQVCYLGAVTLFKIIILIVIASFIWIPVGVWIGLNPKIREFSQPIIQFLAAFPINLIYPIAVTLILYYNLNVEIWTTPLMILGTQWYILFNVIAGAATIPRDLQLAVKNFGLSSWLKWKRLILPVIFPYYVTGAMTAAAGCWNVSIVSEVLAWGDEKLVATGLGSYITEHTAVGDFPRIVLGIAVMCCYVVLINRLLWQRLYHLATSRFALES